MKKMNRRLFLSGSTCLMASMIIPGTNLPCAFSRSTSDIRGSIFKNDAPERLWKWSAEGFLYKKFDDGRVMCQVCPNFCLLSPGDRSICRSKVNMNGTLYTLCYGNPCSINVDPVEKKPLYHFRPGTRVFSLAATGCNFRCLNCQNWEISQARPEEVRHYELFPEDAVRETLRNQSHAIAYTYSEATTYIEYMIAIARLAKEKHIANLWISNGYINEEPLKTLCSLIDAANVNLKSFSDDIYRKLNGGKLPPVLSTFKTLHRYHIHFEMTHLVVPSYTDDEEMVKKMCGWILENLGPDYPLHYLRFFPQYKLDRLSPTPVSTLEKFRDVSMKAGVRYVYIGNVPGHDGNHTYCHRCGKRLIERKGYQVEIKNMKNGKCTNCLESIPGVWNSV